MANFLLVHGGFHTAWCWHALIPRLEAAGHCVMAPDLPTLAAPPAAFGEGGLLACVSRVVPLLDVLSPSSIVVGHGAGCVVAAQAAEERPERVAATVSISGLLLRSGENISSFLADGRRFGFDEQIANRLRVIDNGKLAELDVEAALDLLYQCTPPELAREAARRLRLQPTALFTDPTLLTEGAWGSVPRYYVSCSEDRTNSSAFQRWMVGRVPCRHVYQLDTDHAPFFSAPEALADALLDVARRVGEASPGAAASG